MGFHSVRVDFFNVEEHVYLYVLTFESGYGYI